MILELDLSKIANYSKETLDNAIDIKINNAYYKRTTFQSCDRCSLSRDNLCFYRYFSDFRCRASFIKADMVNGNLTIFSDVVSNWATSQNINAILLKTNPAIHDRIMSIVDCRKHLVSLYDKSSYQRGLASLNGLHRKRKAVIYNIMKHSQTNILMNKYVFGFIDKNDILNFLHKGKLKQSHLNYSIDSTAFFYNTQDAYYLRTGRNNFNHCNYCGRISIPKVQDLQLKQLEDDGTYMCQECSKLHKTSEGVCDVCSNKRSIIVPEKVSEELKEVFSIKTDVVNICNGCKRTYTTKCVGCGKLIPKTSSAAFCRKCRTGQILDHDYKPAKLNYKKGRLAKNTNLFFGLEIELESERSNLIKLVNTVNNKLHDLAYYKEDGSLSNGFEIVLEPMTYNFIFQNKSLFNQALNDLVKAGGYSFSSENTGLHIHLSKKAFFDTAHLVAFCKCFYMNKKFTEHIADREANTFCSFSEGSQKAILHEIAHPEDRYRAINFTNQYTIEIRIYKGNLKFPSILTYIQHCLCCYMYSKQCVQTSTPVTILGLINYINHQSENFDGLKKKVESFIPKK